MALLHVVALGNPGLAAAGNRNPARILFSVTNALGAGVTGLSAANVRIETLLVGAGGSNLVVNRFGGAGSGFGSLYSVDVVPTGTHPWARGEFDFAVLVTRGTTDHGQTLGSFRVP